MPVRRPRSPRVGMFTSTSLVTMSEQTGLRMTVAQVLAGAVPDGPTTVCGWVRTRRDSKGGFSFIELNDGSAFDNLQVVAPAALPNYASEVQKLHTGASVAVTGAIVATPGREQAFELQATAIRVLGFADPATYPLQKQRTSLDHLRTIAHLRPRTNTFGAVARVRSAVAAAIHEFFMGRGFVWIPTPIVTASDCEGAGEMFQVTTLDVAKPPRTPEGAVDYAQDFFAKRAFLTVSGQLAAENFACALGNVYTFGPTFRAENSNTTRHLAEFWMIEPEMAFAELEDDMRVAEEFVKFIVATTLKRCSRDMKFFDERIQPGLIAMLEEMCASEFVRVSYTEAIDILLTAKVQWEFPPAWGADLQAEHQRHLTEEHFKKPVIVHDWPAAIKPFYMKVNPDGKTVRAMDVLVPRFGEVIGGSQREERLDVLDQRLDQMKMDKAPYWWYRELRTFGTVPHAGFGLGFERMLQYLTGMQNIRDVIPFPRTPGNAEF